MSKTKIAVVAGASGGIGSAVCRFLKGYKIVPVDRTHGIGLCSLPKEVDAKLSHVKHVDLFVYCVGIGYFGRVEEGALSETVDMSIINLEAAMWLTQIILRKMERGGQLIYVASNSAHYEFPNNAVYGATKAGLRHFARTLFQEKKADGIRVSIISPGTVDTDGFWSHGVDNRNQVVPLQPEDIAKCVEFILHSRGNILEMEIMPDAR